MYVCPVDNRHAPHHYKRQRPYAFMNREDYYSFSEYSFQLDETIDFGKWIENCLNASRSVLIVIAPSSGSQFKLRIIYSVPPEAKEHRVPDICTIEQFHKKVGLNAS